MTRILIFVLLASCGHACFSQQRELDSLLQVLHGYTQLDTTRINLLNDIAYYYSRAEPKKGLQMADEAIELANQLHLDGKLASAYTYKAMNHAGLGEDSMALQYYERALAIHEQMGNELRMATTYNNIAITLVNLSAYADALSYHQKAYAVFEKLSDSVRMGNSLNNRGVIYLYLADYRQALEMYQQALRIFERLQNKAVTANALSNIGLVYNHLSESVKSLQYQQQAYELYKEAGDKQGMINALGNMGNVYHDMDSNATALEYYQRALDLSHETGNKRTISSNLSNMGIVHSGLGNYAEALAYFDTSLKLNTEAGDKKRIAGDLHEIGKIYFLASDAFLRRKGVKNRFASVRDYQLRSLELSEEIGSLDTQREAWDILSRAYEAEGQHAKALNAYKNYIQLRDSIINNEVKNDIVRKEMAHEFERREMELKAEQAQRDADAAAALSRQRILKNSGIAIAIVVLVAGVVTFLFYKRKRDADEKHKLAEFRLHQAENEMDVLLLQMNPHFIFNSLNSINYFIDQNEKDKSTWYTTKFARLMRLTLENSRKKEISLASDLELLQLYLDLEALRLRNTFSYEIKVDEHIDPEHCLVPPMLLQPFVENSIWHGITGKADGKICVEVKRENGMLHYAVEDNGVGRQAAKTQTQSPKKSMGIQITSKRIELLNELRDKKASLRITDLAQGTRVELSLQYETE